MIRYIDSAHNISNSIGGKAWPHYDVVVELNNGLRIIRNGIRQFVYALIDGDDNLVIPYCEGEISVIAGTEFLEISNRYSSEIRIFDFKGNEIIKVPCSSVEYVDGFFIVSKSYNKYGQNNSQLYGLYSKDGEEKYPIEYNAIMSIAPNILKLTQEKNTFSSSDTYENFLWFVTEDKKIDIPVGYIDLINNGTTLFVHPLHDEEQHYNTRESGYMLLSSSGNILSPQNTLDIGFFNEEGIATISVKSEIYGIWRLDGFIDWNGNLYHRCNSKLIPMPTGFDWVSDFQNGIADTYTGKYTGHINMDYQKVVKIQQGKQTKYVPLPHIYSIAIDSDSEFIQVIKDDLMGIISCDGNDIIPATYLHIDIVSDQKLKLYRFVCYKANESYIHEDYNGIHCHGNADIYDTQGNKLNNSSISNPVYLGHGFFRCNCIEEKIKRIKPNYYGGFETLNLQIINSQCSLISELKFSEVLRFGGSREYSEPHMEDENAPYAIFMRGDTWGAINKLGEIVLIGVETQLEIKDIPALILKDCYSPDLHDLCNIKVPFQHNYKSVKYVGYGLFLVETDKSHLNDEWDKTGTSYVDITNRELAPLSGWVSEIKNNLFVSSVWGDGMHLSAVINIHGDIIIPYCDSEFEIYKSFILARNENYEPYIYSAQGKIIVPVGVYKNGSIFEDFLDRFILIRWPGNESIDLIDIHGNVIYNGYSAFEKVVPGILKISNREKEYLGDYYGEILSKGYKEIKVYKNGLCRVSERRRIGIGYGDYGTYDKYEIFYGIIKITGETVIPVKYKFVDIFENENIIKTSVGNMTYDGKYITFYDSADGKTKLILGKEYDYCLPFTNDVAIVFSGDKCGIIDISLNVIFPTICSDIVTLSNGIYKFKLNGLWGIFKIDDGIIIPNKYSEIQEFQDGIAKVVYTPSNTSNIHYYGLINLTEELIKPTCSILRILSNSIIVYVKDGVNNNSSNWTILDIRKNRILSINRNITFIGDISEDLVRVCINNVPSLSFRTTLIAGGKWGYMNIDGDIIIDPKYDECLDFINQIGPVKLGEKWGFINKNGDLIVPFEYEEVEKRYDGYIGIKDYQYKYASWFQFDNHGNITDQGSYYEDSGYDDSSRVYDNPNYNDNLDMDQQSIDFWNNL